MSRWYDIWQYAVRRWHLHSTHFKPSRKSILTTSLLNLEISNAKNEIMIANVVIWPSLSPYSTFTSTEYLHHLG